jgi:hypothetical protein
MARTAMQVGAAILVGVWCFWVPRAVGLPGASINLPQTASASNATSSANQATSATRQARRRAARRRRRELAIQQQAAENARGKTYSSSTQGAEAAQRERDTRILAAQQARSAATARENDAQTGKLIHDQQQQQAEPRIQDAPGPGSQPLPGNPAVPASAPADPPRIQDAPGPAQTLPKAPPQL